jgi:hypothetical protein
MSGGDATLAAGSATEKGEKLPRSEMRISVATILVEDLATSADDV